MRQTLSPSPTLPVGAYPVQSKHVPWGCGFGDAEAGAQIAAAPGLAVPAHSYCCPPLRGCTATVEEIVARMFSNGGLAKGHNLHGVFAGSVS